ncbi:DUF6193 family natural product biosynthesis protein [Actinacidiphila acidipaludis]|uniref:Uncharacterized protein n=1 Tax=Actinacidiphila acidipaludis TaxID=2873382 RepID=A0ABS7Q4F0_9ACTN|nr:DUF6193 family natural product biosynthesis protein [Streptomyces acidipaludis]MBY8877992.1 hypothetical protein [Streptomyces acidipaludis]
MSAFASAGAGAEGKAPDPVLYPDLVAAGGIDAALRRIASDLGLDLGEVPGGAGYAGGGPARSGPDAYRQPLTVHLASEERAFIVSGWSRGVELVRGRTPDLHQVARAAAVWRSGASLHELRALCPFVTFGELAEAHERGPADAVAVKWRQLRESLHGGVPSPTVRSLVEAAFAEPKLRQLYPFTSQRSLHFTTCTGYPFTWVVPFVDPLQDGRFRVCGPSRRAVIGETDTAEEAVALVVRNLPADIGPAVAGTARD